MGGGHRIRNSFQKVGSIFANIGTNLNNLPPYFKIWSLGKYCLIGGPGLWGIIGLGTQCLNISVKINCISLGYHRTVIISLILLSYKKLINEKE